MGRRKLFTKTDLSIPQVEHSRDAAGNVVVLPEAIPPANTTVEFGRNASSCRTFDFAPWYGAYIDAITYACQQQIRRFLAGMDGAVEASTVTNFCHSGLRHFLDYSILRATAFGRDLTLTDLDRNLIDGYLGHLAGLGVNPTSQRNNYNGAKSVLLALGRRGLINLIASGDAATFPRNPFPNSNRKMKGETALNKHERQAFAATLRQALIPLWCDGVQLTSELLVYALMMVALHTGRNTTPLLEMRRDCLRPHPKDNNVFLVLWKRRGHNSSKVALRAESESERVLESTPTVRTNVERLICRVLTLTEPLNAEAPADIKGRVWLYRSRSSGNVDQVTTLIPRSLNVAIKRLVANHQLTDSNDQPLRINISRLRKTFGNRIYELADGDLATTAIALGNTPKVADRNYLAPGEDTRRNWRFMGELLVQELLSQTIGATYTETPMGRCADPIAGQYAPKRDGASCFAFTNCLRCKHYAVTADDLYKLFSFYFRVLAERSRMDKRRWVQEYAHIPRLIDNYIVAEGLRRSTFKSADVDANRERARSQPHPFWSVDLIDSLEVFA
ncbi:hypothetical protein [Pseudomonas ficuserectae]|uniref:hypothetical protein n=1 Tax=Pseudomonas ficuserectae TaxID=53410 RepID=UPI00211CEB2D|nr:hypothetical protein [Pseudomonas ficuserectae]